MTMMTMKESTREREVERNHHKPIVTIVFGKLMAHHVFVVHNKQASEEEAKRFRLAPIFLRQQTRLSLANVVEAN